MRTQQSKKRRHLLEHHPQNLRIPRQRGPSPIAATLRGQRVLLSPKRSPQAATSELLFSCKYVLKISFLLLPSCILHLLNLIFLSILKEFCWLCCYLLYLITSLPTQLLLISPLLPFPPILPLLPSLSLEKKLCEEVNTWEGAIL